MFFNVHHIGGQRCNFFSTAECSECGGGGKEDVMETSLPEGLQCYHWIKYTSLTLQCRAYMPFHCSYYHFEIGTEHVSGSSNGRENTIHRHTGLWCSSYPELFVRSGGHWMGFPIKPNGQLATLTLKWNWQAGYWSRTPPGNCLVSHITPHYIYIYGKTRCTIHHHGPWMSLKGMVDAIYGIMSGFQFMPSILLNIYRNDLTYLQLNVFVLSTCPIVEK